MGGASWPLGGGRRGKLGAAELSGCWSSKCCGCVPGCAYVCFPCGDRKFPGADECMCIINTCPLVCIGPICCACRLGEHQQWICTWADAPRHLDPASSLGACASCSPTLPTAQQVTTHSICLPMMKLGQGVPGIPSRWSTPQRCIQLVVVTHATAAKKERRVRAWSGLVSLTQ